MLTIDHKAQFLRLASDLSPENLYADGERTEAQARVVKRKITADWRKLEAEVGQQVTQSDAWAWVDEVRDHRAKQVAKRVAAQPQNDLVKSKNPGVWVRDGKNGLSAYYIWGPQHSGTRYTLFSEFAYRLVGDREKLGEFDSLDEAVAAGEAFLATVTYEAVLKRNPRYRPENIKRELERLPEGFEPGIPPLPKVTSFTLRFGSGESTTTIANVKPEDVGAILMTRLTERDQFCSITSA